MRKNVAAMMALGATLAMPTLAGNLTGNFTLKEAEQERYRLNLVTSLGDFVVGTRHDAELNKTSQGYGLDFARCKLGRIQAGLASAKTPAGRGQYAQIFYGGKGLLLHGDVPLSGATHGPVVFGEYTFPIGQAQGRVNVIDDLGLPRVQKFEAELAGPEMKALAGARPMVQYNRVGTSEGYSTSLEFGVRFNYYHRGRR